MLNRQYTGTRFFAIVARSSRLHFCQRTCVHCEVFSGFVVYAKKAPTGPRYVEWRASIFVNTPKQHLCTVRWRFARCHSMHTHRTLYMRRVFALLSEGSGHGHVRCNKYGNEIPEPIRPMYCFLQSPVSLGADFS